MSATQPTLRDNLRALPRSAWIIFFGTFLNKFGTFVLPFLAIYLKRLGYTTAQSGLAVGAYGFGHLAASLLGGYLADRIERRRTIVLSMFSAAAAMLCLSQARTLPALIVLAALAGLTGELYRPAGAALLTDLVPPDQRVTAFAAYRIAFNAGWTFGPATAGFLAKKSFVWLFVGDAATSVLYGLIAWLALPATPSHAPTGSAPKAVIGLLRDDRRLRQIMLASLAVGLVFVQVFSSLSLLVMSSGFSAAAYGMLISLNGALVVLAELPMTRLTRRRAPRSAMALGWALIGLAFASNLLERTGPLLVLTMVMLTLGEIISMPIALAYVANLAPAHQRGLYLGAFGLVWAVAFLLGPSLGLWLYAISPALLWTLCGMLGLTAAALILDAGPSAQVAKAQAVAKSLEAG